MIDILQKSSLSFTVPEINSIDFTLDEASNVDASWTTTDICNVTTSYVVTGYNTEDSSDTVSVTAPSSAATAEMASALFTECSSFVFDVILIYGASGSTSVGPSTIDPLVPNIPGSNLIIYDKPISILTEEVRICYTRVYCELNGSYKYCFLLSGHTFSPPLRRNIDFFCNHYA